MRKKKGSFSKVVKVIPLSMAAAAISSGMLFASAAEAPYDVVRIETGTGYVDYDLNNTDEAYKTALKTALKNAFLDETKSIVVVDTDDSNKQVEFGKNAGTATLDQMWADPDNYQPANPY